MAMRTFKDAYVAGRGVEKGSWTNSAKRPKDHAAFIGPWPLFQPYR